MRWLFAILMAVNGAGFSAHTKAKTEEDKQRISTRMATVNLIFVAIVVINTLLYVY
jgi:hypothetical protein